MDKTQFFNTFKPTVEPIQDLPGVWIKALSARDFLSINNDEDNTKKTALIMVLSCCDEQGNLIFDKEDMDKLLDLPAHFSNSITQAFLSVNKLSVPAFDELKKK